jgi:pimeloyl-ACP methyl ester carboxylesterase
MFQSHSINLKGGSVKYLVGGQGPALLYLHSGGGVSPNAVHESYAKSFTVYMPTTPGFDGTPTIDGIKSMSDLADLWAAFIDMVIKAEKVDLLGFSFGGCAAAWLAAKHPAKVDLLVLQAPGGFAVPGTVKAIDDPAERAKAFYKYPQNLPKGEVPGARGQANRPAAGRYYTAYDKSLVDRLGDIAALTLVLLGTEDKLVPAEAGHLLKAAIKRSFLIYVYDSAHGLEVDQPRRTASLVEDFFKRGEVFIVNQGSTKAA